MKHWFALYTKSHKEQQVCSFLQSKGLETYLPTVKIRKNGNYRVTPFFSCYLFVRADPLNGLFSLRWTPGLRKVVSFGDQPAVVDDNAVSFLRQRLAEMQESGYEEYRFKPGDRVVMTSGPLRDFEAVFERGLSSGQRARLLVDFLGRWTRCEVEIDRLKKVR
ncbi:MAG: transcription termination/antitermination NusG family protein [Anaerolineae bacterium]